MGPLLHAMSCAKALLITYYLQNWYRYVKVHLACYWIPNHWQFLCLTSYKVVPNQISSNNVRIPDFHIVLKLQMNRQTKRSLTCCITISNLKQKPLMALNIIFVTLFTYHNNVIQSCTGSSSSVAFTVISSFGTILFWVIPHQWHNKSLSLYSPWRLIHIRGVPTRPITPA